MLNYNTTYVSADVKWVWLAIVWNMYNFFNFEHIGLSSQVVRSIGTNFQTIQKLTADPNIMSATLVLVEVNEAIICLFFSDHCT